MLPTNIRVWPAGPSIDNKTLLPCRQIEMNNLFISFPALAAATYSLLKSDSCNAGWKPGPEHGLEKLKALQTNATTYRPEAAPRESSPCRLASSSESIPFSSTVRNV